jgi:hypothetical protein
MAAKLKFKGTSITTMRTKCRSIATFHRPIHSHWSLPLIKMRRWNTWSPISCTPSPNHCHGTNCTYDTVRWHRGNISSKIYLGTGGYVLELRAVEIVADTACIFYTHLHAGPTLILSICIKGILSQDELPKLS